MYFPKELYITTFNNYHNQKSKTMNNLFLLVLNLFIFNLGNPTQADDILGVWLNENQTGKIEIYKEGGKYFGKIIYAKPPLGSENELLVDKKNPDPNLRNQPILGMTVLKDLVFKNGKWVNGTAYSPERGKHFKIIGWLEEEGQLEIRGYWGFFYSTETWTKH